MMNKTKINVQDQYLNQSRRERISMNIKMLSGEIHSGMVKSFDNFCIVIETDRYVLIYKHAIATIEPTSKTAKVNLFQQTPSK